MLFICGSAAQSVFKCLRDRYDREKKQIKKSQAIGTGANEAGLRTSDLRLFLRETVTNVCGHDSGPMKE